MAAEFLLTVDELAAQARLNPYTVRRYIRDGVVQAKMIGRQYVIRSTEAARLLGYRPEQPKTRKPS